MEYKMNQIINEASFPTSSIGKVMKTIISLLEKKTGLKIYKPKVAIELQLTKGLQGMRFFIEGKKSFRINWKGSEIVSVTLWPSITSLMTKTIDLRGLNSVQTVNLLAEVIGGKKSTPSETPTLKFEDFKRPTVSFSVALNEVASNVAEKQKQQNVFNRYLATNPTFKNKAQLVDGWVEYAKRNGVSNPVKSIAWKADTANMSGRVANGDKGIEQAAAEAEAKADKLSPESVFKQISVFTKMVIDGSKKGIIISGDPGIGKCVIGKTLVSCIIEE